MSDVEKVKALIIEASETLTKINHKTMMTPQERDQIIEKIATLFIPSLTQLRNTLMKELVLLGVQ
jgi:hypothetical protein